ncbi:MAG: chemotaxis protein CheW [Verrucomicrobiae bacterium]
MNAAFFQREPDAADRERWRREIAATPPAADHDARLVLFVFRVGGERFGIEPSHVEHATPLPDIHSMPHRGVSVAGVVNVRGTVTLCFSLTHLLGSAPGPAPARPMLLVLARGGWRVACRVDEAEGMSSFVQSDLQATPSTLQSAGHAHVKGIFESGNGPGVGWLDADSLFEAFDAATR